MSHQYDLVVFMKTTSTRGAQLIIKDGKSQRVNYWRDTPTMTLNNYIVVLR